MNGMCIIRKRDCRKCSPVHLMGDMYGIGESWTDVIHSDFHKKRTDIGSIGRFFEPISVHLSFGILIFPVLD